MMRLIKARKTLIMMMIIAITRARTTTPIIYFISILIFSIVSLQASQSSVTKLRDELASVRRERAGLSARVAELKSALTSCVQHAKVSGRETTKRTVLSC